MNAFCPSCFAGYGVPSMFECPDQNPPKPGDFVVCMSCAELLIMDEATQLVVMAEAQLRQVRPEIRMEMLMTQIGIITKRKLRGYQAR